MIPSNSQLLTVDNSEEYGVGTIFYTNHISLFVSVADPRMIDWLRENETYQMRSIALKNDIVMNARECPHHDAYNGVSIFVDRDRIIR